MILHVTAQGLTLKDPGNFNAYKVQIDGPEGSKEEVIGLHPQLRRIDPGHVAVARETLERLAGGLASDREWVSGFAGMVAYARSRGWVTEAEEIVGHIE